MQHLTLLTEQMPQPGGDLITLPIMLAMSVGIIYFMFILPDKKRRRQAEELLSKIQIADEVVTSGGIIGRVINIETETETLLLETGGAKTRIRVLRSAIVENKTIHD